MPLRDTLRKMLQLVLKRSLCYAWHLFLLPLCNLVLADVTVVKHGATSRTYSGQY